MTQQQIQQLEKELWDAADSHILFVNHSLYSTSLSPDQKSCD